MVAVDENEVHSQVPVPGGGLAGGHMPANAGRGAAAGGASHHGLHRFLVRGLPPIHSLPEWLDQVKLGVDGQRVQQHERGGAFVDADLDRPAPALGELAEEGGLRRRVHRARRNQPGPQRERPQSRRVAEAVGHAAADDLRQHAAHFGTAMAEPRSVEEVNGILLFNCAFFGTIAWLASAAVVAKSDGWWYELGQIALALAGVVLFWIAWWFDEHGRARRALQVAGPAVAVLSIWVTSVYAVLF
jgi:hypothetical protein